MLEVKSEVQITMYAFTAKGTNLHLATGQSLSIVRVGRALRQSPIHPTRLYQRIEQSQLGSKRGDRHSEVIYQLFCFLVACFSALIYTNKAQPYMPNSR